VQQFLGSATEGGTSNHTPLMTIEMGVAVYTHLLVGGNPRALVRTPHTQLRATAKDLGMALNHTVDEVHLEDTLLRLVQDALFSIGICKIGLCNKDSDKAGGFWHDLWQPYVDRVDLDDWVHDTNATSWESVAYEGNRYRMPLWMAKESEDFNKKAREALTATLKTSTNEDGDDKIEDIQYDTHADIDEYQDYVELWDFWLPEENLVLTMADQNDSIGALRVEKWEGPERGPYCKLSFTTVPNTTMPLPPVAVWRELHDLANHVYSKLGGQAKRQKSVLPVRGGDEGDIQAIKDSKDGDILRIDGEVTKEVSYGGPTQINLAFLLSTMNFLNRQQGNTDTLGGLSTGADTLGQEQLLAQQANERITFMRKRTVAFTSNIFDSLAFYLFDDPFVNIPMTKTSPGGHANIPINWSGEDIEDDYREFNISIQPYSMVYRSPTQMLQVMMQLLKEIILPLGPQMAQQGVTINFEAMLKQIAEYADFPELNSFMVFTGQPGAYEHGPVGQPSGGGPTETTRNYNRTSSPGPSGQSQQNSVLSQMLMGKPPQQGETDGLSGF